VPSDAYDFEFIHENKARFFAQDYGIEVLKSDFDDFIEKNAVLAVNFEYSNVIKSGYLEVTPGE
jgi:hypothetical protein